VIVGTGVGLPSPTLAPGVDGAEEVVGPTVQAASVTAVRRTAAAGRVRFDMRQGTRARSTRFPNLRNTA
jgi:hypothetical protein